VGTERRLIPLVDLKSSSRNLRMYANCCFETAIEMQCAQLQTRRGSCFEPALTRAFEARRYHRLARAFCHATADREAALARCRVVDLVAVVVEVSEMSLDDLHVRASESGLGRREARHVCTTKWAASTLRLR